MQTIEAKNGANMPKTWTLSLSDPWMGLVRSGGKTYEGRLFRGLPKHFKVGDLIEFYSDQGGQDPPVVVKILKILKYKTFRESLQDLPIEQVLPTLTIGEKITVDEGEKIYWKYASQDSQLKWGVCQIQIQLK